MFTLEEIHTLHQKLGSRKSLALYVAALKELGVRQIDSYVTDGHSVYVGEGGYQISDPPVHESLHIVGTSDRESMLRHLARHEAGETDYMAMSRGLAASGIQKWTINTHESTIIYSDRYGNPLLVETIE